MDRPSVEKQDMDLNMEQFPSHSGLSKRYSPPIAETYLDQTDLAYKPSLEEKMKEVQKKI